MEQFVKPDTIFLVKLFWKENQADFATPHDHEETTTLDMQYDKDDAVEVAQMHALRLAADRGMKLTRRGNHWWLSEGGGEGTCRMEIYLLQVPDKG